MKLMRGDCLELMKEIPDGSVNLIVTDPPYNMGKSKEWDKFKREDYLSFMGEVFSESHRVLADNGQMYFFHNDIETISELVQYLRNETGFVFSSFLVFPKPKFRRLSWSNPTDKNNLRSWFNICEFALLYINSDCVATEWDITGWERVKMSFDTFRNLKEYSLGARKYVEELEGETMSQNKLGRDIGNTTAVHFFTGSNNTQWSLPPKRVYDLIVNRYNLKGWSGFREYEDLRREYEDLRREYEDLRPVHNLDVEHCNVWNVEWRNNGKFHPCEKPVEILERMIRTSSKPGAVVLDPFMGSGSTGVACVNTGRDFIGIEKDDKYFEVAEERIRKAEEERQLAYTD